MPRVLRFTLIGCGGLIVLIVLVGMVAACGTEPSSPPERAEQDEGVEGGGKEPEAKQPLEGEKTRPQEQQPKPEEGTLYELAVSEPLPAYKIDFTASDTDQRLDVYVTTAKTADKPRLGRILIDLQEKSGADLVTAFFCTTPGEQACTNTLFATGELAQTAQGRGFMGLDEDGEVPFMRIEF